MTNFDAIKEFIENSYGDEIGRANALEALNKLRAEIILECAAKNKLESTEDKITMQLVLTNVQLD